MMITLQITEKSNKGKSYRKLDSYKNNVEIFKSVDVKQKQKTTTLIYYVGIDIDVAKLLEKEIV